MQSLELAVPGTYIAGEPLVTIAAFAPQLHVISSKQRPRKLTIHGSDGAEYMFLLKVGCLSPGSLRVARTPCGGSDVWGDCSLQRRASCNEWYTSRKFSEITNLSPLRKCWFISNEVYRKIVPSREPGLPLRRSGEVFSLPYS